MLKVMEQGQQVKQYIVETCSKVYLKIELYTRLVLESDGDNQFDLAEMLVVPNVCVFQDSRLG